MKKQNSFNLFFINEFLFYEREKTTPALMYSFISQSMSMIKLFNTVQNNQEKNVAISLDLQLRNKNYKNSIKILRNPRTFPRKISLERM